MSKRRRVQIVTTVGRSASEDISARQRRYLYSMAIRTVALVLAIFVLHGPFRFLALIAGMVLPWISVTNANAGPLPASGDRPELVEAEERRALPPGGPSIDMD